jgi:hypothetical protein
MIITKETLIFQDIMCFTNFIIIEFIIIDIYYDKVARVFMALQH